jgi:methyl-accepting chemotaxis protein
MNFASLKVSTRLALGFGAAVLLGLVIALTGAVQMHSLNNKVNELALDRMPKMDKLSSFTDNMNATAQAVRNVLLTTEPTAKAAEVKLVQDMRQANGKLLKELDEMLVLPRGRELFKVITDNLPAFRAAQDQVLALDAQGKSEEAAALLFGDLRSRQAAMIKALDELTEQQSTIARTLAAEAGSTASFSTSLMLAGAALMALVGGLMGWALSRSLGRALGAEPGELNEAVRRIADGDLAQPLVLRSGDSASTLAAVARMQQALAGIVQSVRGNSDSVATASAQIAQGNQDLSSRTEEQASALQQTAASMEQLGSAVKHSADNAAQANQLAQGASQVAVKGGTVVSEVVATMRGINEASQRIADIIGTIDGIAFQTNILALNAAVEAARAGEQGRGFAVVASEVRSLAQRSADAAKEIKTLIMTSVERVERGSVLVDEAGVTMTEVVDAIRRVTDLMGEISAASTEQSTGVSQVGEAVTQMDQATQQNAALVEESAAAAESLKEQARQLVEAVSVFQLGGTAVSARPAAARARSAPKATAAARPPTHAAASKPFSAPAPRPVAKAAAARKPVAAAAPLRTPALAAATPDGEWADF